MYGLDPSIPLLLLPVLIPRSLPVNFGFAWFGCPPYPPPPKNSSSTLGIILAAFKSAEKKGSFSNDDGDGSENVKKSNRLIKQNNNFARASRFLYISLPPLQDYNVKMPNFTFCGGRKQATTNFSFSF